MSKLIESLPEWLKKELTPAEEKLLTAIENNEAVNFSQGTDIDKPENVSQWGKDRTIRAEFLHYVCTNKNIRDFISNNGVQIIGAKIEGELNFHSVTLPFIFRLLRCSMKDVILMDAETKALNFNGSHIASFIADSLTVKGGVFLNEVKAKGEVRLLGANISGNLECTKAVFENPERNAFIAENLKIIWLDTQK